MAKFINMALFYDSGATEAVQLIVATAPQDKIVSINLDGVEFNMSDEQSVGRSRRDTPEPKNNDGRHVCYWCNCQTRKVVGFSGVYDHCSTCGK